MTQIFINTTVITLNLTEFSIRIELFFTENVTPILLLLNDFSFPDSRKFAVWTQQLLKFFTANQQLL